MAHGDDFIVSGTLEYSARFRNQEGGLDVNTAIRGSVDSLAKEMRILCRGLVWHKDLVLYEVDPKHAEVRVRDTGAAHATTLGTQVVLEMARR